MIERLDSLEAHAGKGVEPTVCSGTMKRRAPSPGARRRRGSLAAALLLAALGAPGTAASAEAPLPAGGLAAEASPYLRAAAGQPVRWQPWGEAALTLARRLGRPVLLDIGAAWCHWCHVMDRESYAQPALAEVINREFVPVKVDRDARPDVDLRYQTAAAAAFGAGGWPLTAFLTPDGELIFAGTYFPADDRADRPGFGTVLATVAEAYREAPEAVGARARAVTARLAGLEGLAAVPGEPGPRLREALLGSILGELDRARGGFPAAGGAQFPRPGALAFLLRRAVEAGDPGLSAAVTAALDRMADGAIHDHVGGGFHRYTVDPEWRVPHFEKMTAANAELLSLYLWAYQATGSARYREVAEGIVAFAERLEDPDGGFWASQAADGPDGVEGSAYTWTAEEIAEALEPEERAVIARLFDPGSGGSPPRGEPGRHALARGASVEDLARERGQPGEEVRTLLGRALARLRAAREARGPARVDRSRYVDTSALMIRAWLEASVVLGRADLQGRALGSLGRLLAASHVAGKGVSHRWGERGPDGPLLQDQVAVAGAALAAFELTGQARFLAAATDLLEGARRALWDPERGGFLDHPPAPAEGLLARPVRPIQDAAVASGNGAAALALLRLAALTGEPAHGRWAEETLRAFAGRAGDLGARGGAYALALDFHLEPPVQVAVIGSRGDPPAMELWRAALATFRPGKVAVLADPAASVEGLPAPVRAKLRATQAGDGPQAYVCAGRLCSLPVRDPARLAALIRAFGGPGAAGEQEAGPSGFREGATSP